jgi:hypothetical protein
MDDLVFEVLWKIESEEMKIKAFDELTILESCSQRQFEI